MITLDATSYLISVYVKFYIFILSVIPFYLFHLPTRLSVCHSRPSVCSIFLLTAPALIFIWLNVNAYDVDMKTVHSTSKESKFNALPNPPVRPTDTSLNHIYLQYI